MSKGSIESAPLLHLIAERKLDELLGEFAPQRLEASGVCIQDGMAIVVFDNLAQMARIDPSLEVGAGGHALIGLPVQGTGYEGITWDQAERRFYVVVEAVEHTEGFRGQVQVFDERLVLLETLWLGYPLDAENKGFEGLVHMRRGGVEYLLGLCEGNKCRAGTKGEKPGNGRVQVYRKAADEGETLASANLAYLYMDNGFEEEARNVLDAAGKREFRNERVGRADADLSARTQAEAEKWSDFLQVGTKQKAFLQSFAEAYFVRAKGEFHGTWLTGQGRCELAEHTDGQISAEWGPEAGRLRLEGHLRNRGAVISWKKENRGLLLASGPRFGAATRGLAFLTDDGSCLRIMLAEETPEFIDFRRA